MIQPPPPVLDHLWIREFAIVGAGVEWTDRQDLYVDGLRLGPVPCLALGQDLRHPDEETLLLHCDAEWTVLGVAALPSLQAAKEKAERAYQGITGAWQESGATADEAARWIANLSGSDGCSFCGRLPPEVERMIAGARARICGDCIRAFGARSE